MTIKENLAILLSYFQEQMAAVKGYLQPEMLREIGREDKWSAKDNMIHALVWANRRAEMLETIVRGEPWIDTDYGDFNDTNREIFEEHRDKIWDDVQVLVSSTYKRGLVFIDLASDEQLLQKKEGDDRPFWRIIADNFITHPMIHVWELLQKSGRTDTLIEIFGENFAEMLQKLDPSDHWQGLIEYNQACLFALSGELTKSINALEKALKLNPDLTEWSKQDADLEAIRALPAYQALYDQE